MMHNDSILRKQLFIRCLWQNKEEYCVQHYLNAQYYVKDLCESRFIAEAPQVIQPKYNKLDIFVPCNAIDKQKCIDDPEDV